MQYFDWQSKADLTAGIYLVITPERFQEVGRQFLHAYFSQDVQQIELHRKNLVSAIVEQYASAMDDPFINDFLVELDWIVEDEINSGQEYLEAQFMGYIHLISSRLAALIVNGDSAWIDSRDVFMTDESWTNAPIQITEVEKGFSTFQSMPLVICSAQVGVTSDNENTLLAEEAIRSIIQ